MPHYRIKKLHRIFKNEGKIFFLPLVILSVLLISGCSLLSDDSSDGAFSGRNASDARKVELKKSIGLDDLREIAESDSEQTANATGIKTTNGQFLDFKTDLLFEDRLRDKDDRLDRLENAVQDIHNDFSKMLPAINRLISIEGDIKELHKQLSILVDNGSLDEESKQAKPSSFKKENVKLPVPERPKSTKKKAPSKAATVTSLKVNVGDHADKTRVVIKTPKKENFNVSFDKDNQLVTIESNISIPSSQLKIASRKSKKIMEGSPNLQSTKNNASVLLTKDIKSISKGAYIGPTDSKNYHRYYFDLFL